MPNASFVKGKLLQVHTNGSVGKLHLNVFADWCAAKRPHINWISEYADVCVDLKTIAFARGSTPLYVTEQSQSVFKQLDGSYVTAQVYPERLNGELNYIVMSRMGSAELGWIASFNITETTLYTHRAKSIGGAVVITLDQFCTKATLKDPEQVKAASIVANLLNLESVWVFIPEPLGA